MREDNIQTTNNILDLSSSFDFNNNNVVKGEIEIDDVFELENNIEILVQDKIIEPTKEMQTVMVDENYDQLGTVTVNPIPDEYIIPDGTLDVDANGDVDVTMFRMARVGVYTPPALQDKLITIVENGTTNIVADEGYDGLGNIEVITDVQNDASITSAMYLIENGIENRDITQGYTFEDFVAQVANANAVKQMDASFNMYSGLWARGNVTFNADFDFTQCKKMYIEYEFPATNLISSMRQYMDVTVRLLDQAGETLTAVQIVGGRTVNRTTIEIPLDDINQVGKVFFSSSNLSGTNGAGNSSYSEAYPVRFFNVWFDVIDAAPVLQDKSIEITENGTQTITADEGYDGLNSVEVTSNVEGSASKYAPRRISFYNYAGNELNEEVANLDTSNITNMGYMFYGCNKLTELDLSNFNTGNVTTMTYMFQTCTNLTKLDVSEFNTSNVTDMSQMFQSCSKLTELDLSSFNTSKVTKMGNMFRLTTALKKLDIRNFDFTNVTSSDFIFAGMENDCLIIVKDDAAKAWVLGINNAFTNVKTVAEL